LKIQLFFDAKWIMISEVEFISGEYSRCNSNSVMGIFQARMALPVPRVYVAEKQPDVLTKLPVLIVCVGEKQPDVLTKSRPIR